jgi:hypothetical protein
MANEIARYLQFPTIDGDDDPLQWWKFYVNDFALLSQYVPDNYGKAKVKSKAISQANMLVFLAENV